MLSSVLTFYIDNILFGIDIKLIKEINRNIEFTSIPDSDKNILGLFNMRGQIVTIFSFLEIINVSNYIPLQNISCVILKPLDNFKNSVGFLIDRPGDVVNIKADEEQVPPSNILSIKSKYIKSVVNLEEKLLIIVKPEIIFKI